MTILLFITLIISIILLLIYIIKYSQRKLPPLYPITVSIDHCFYPKEKKYILTSLKQWEHATHGLVTFNVVDMNSRQLIYNDYDVDSGYSINFVRALTEGEYSPA